MRKKRKMKEEEEDKTRLEMQKGVINPQSRSQQCTDKKEGVATQTEKARAKTKLNNVNSTSDNTDNSTEEAK